MAKITVGLSKKEPGEQQYSSIGHYLTVELEAEVSSPEEFHERVSTLFNDVRAALDAEVARSGSGNGSTRRDLWQSERNSGPSPRTGNGNESEPASNRQVQYLARLLSRHGLSQQYDIAGYLHDTLGITVSSICDLSKVDASRAIEVLKTGQGGSS